MKYQFDKALRKEFDSYCITHERVELRFSAYLLIAINSAFIIVDYFRVEQFMKAVIFRCIFIAIFSGMLFVPFTRLSGLWRNTILMTAHVVILFFIFYMDYATDVLISFLPNVVIAFGFCSFTITALRFRRALILNLGAATLYILHLRLYCATDFHPRQVPVILSTLILSSLVGFLLERSKRQNFLQQREISKYSQQLEKADHQKAMILSILSHDLASPLKTLSGLIAAQNSKLISPEELQTFMGKVQHSVVNTSYLLQNLVRWSRTQMDGFSPTHELVELKKLVKESIEALEMTAVEKKIQVIENVDDRIMIRVDPDMFELIMRNVISNAIKYSRTGSEVKVEARESNDFIEMTVNDFGIGMPEEMRKHVLSKMSKSQPGTMNEKGTGIGLLMTGSFVSILRGQIEIESTEGKGTTVRIRVPKS